MADVSVIGCGNMGGALVRGLAETGTHDLTVYDVDPEAFDAVEGLDVRTTTDPLVANGADIIFLAVKPDLVGVVLDEFDFDGDRTVVSIAAGVETDFVAARTDARVVRLMPNLAAEWGSMAGAVTGAVDADVLAVLEDLGEIVTVDEARMDTATALNGSGPAFVFYLVQAMVRAAVDRGIDPADARILAAQTFKGAAETILRSDTSIDELIDAVCSPQGTTVEGMAVLRESDVDDTLGRAIVAAEERATELATEVDDG